MFDGRRHLPLANYPGMADRTVTISSAAKMFNCTGWKIGWACGAADLIAGVRAAKQYLSYVGGAPFQPAVAQALNTEEAWVAALRESLQAKRDRLGTALDELGFEVHDSFGTYFLCADPRPLGYRRQHGVLRRAAREGRGGRDPDVGVLRPRSRARRRVESSGALRLLQARRHPRRGHPPAGRFTPKLTFGRKNAACRRPNVRLGERCTCGHPPQLVEDGLLRPSLSRRSTRTDQNACRAAPACVGHRLPRRSSPCLPS